MTTTAQILPTTKGPPLMAQSRYAERRDTGRRPASMEFPEKLYVLLQEQSAREEKSMAAIVRHAVKQYLISQGVDVES